MAQLKDFSHPLNSSALLNSFQFQYESSNSHDLSMAAFLRGSLDTFSNI